MRNTFLSLVAALSLSGCLGYPENITPVRDFELENYLGTWYEIARLDHSFERGLQQVSATYSKRPDGGITVLNRGFDPSKNAWEDAEGKAFFAEDENIGYLKVSFFGPFYSSYVVFELDADYQHAFVTGPDKSYLWLLAREKTVDQALIKRFEEQAERLGYPVNELIYVEH